VGKQSYLLDTNILIYIEKGISDAVVLDFLSEATVDGTLISVATEIEVLGFVFSSPYGLQRMEELVADTIVLPLDRDTALRAIAVRRERKIKLGDAIIAATALIHNLTLVTNNTKDFTAIDGLTVVNPFQPTP
jgi:predicted nucleic acid-binding protein